MEAITKTRKIGGSLVVTIPKSIVEEENLTENQTIRIDVKKVKKTGFGIFKELGSFTKKDKLFGQLENNE